MTEAEMQRQLSRDIERPDELYIKPYIHGGQAEDTGRALQEVAAAWLVEHMDKFSEESSRWGMYHTRVEPMEGKDSPWERELSNIKKEGRFYHGTVWPHRVTVTDGMMRICGVYEFGIFTKRGEAGELRLVEIRPANDTEGDLARMLRNYTMARSVAVYRLPGIPEGTRVTTMTLLAGAPDERYQKDKVGTTAIPLLKLAPLLGNQKRYLYQGFYGEPLGTLLEGLSEEEIKRTLMSVAAAPGNLWKHPLMKREGLVAEGDVPVARIVSEWLVLHRDIWNRTDRAMPEVLSGVRLHTAEVALPFRDIRRQGFLPPFGRVLDGAVLFYDRGRGYAVRPSLLLYDKSVTPFASYSLIRLMELPWPEDTLLSAALRTAAHVRRTDVKKLAAAFSLPEDSGLEGRIILPEDMKQRDRFLRDLGAVKPFLSERKLSLLSLRHGAEAMW
ncbi:MAG: hypothetical protein SPI25_07385 [Dialister sp.]|nr:hypothetical protein [Dialister sp.]